jgi:hypothetical protein
LLYISLSCSTAEIRDEIWYSKIGAATIWLELEAKDLFYTNIKEKTVAMIAQSVQRLHHGLGGPGIEFR